MDRYDVASVVLINKNGLLIFQQRDNKPGILNPGMITPWGGAVEEGETPITAAIREVKEETNLQPTQADLEFIGIYPRSYKIGGRKVVCHVYLLKDVDESNLKVHEGEGYILVDPKDASDNSLYTELTNQLIANIGGRILEEPSFDQKIWQPRVL